MSSVEHERDGAEHVHERDGAEQVHERDGAEDLIERLIADPAFRAEFRRNPAAACRAAGFEQLASELAVGGNAMQTLELRESRSSLAGVLMAVAAEGVGVAELRGLLGSHGLRGAHGVLGHGRGLGSKGLNGEGMRPPGRASGAAVHRAAVLLPQTAAGSPAQSVPPSPAPAAAAAPPPASAPAAAAPPAPAAAAAPPAPEPAPTGSPAPPAVHAVQPSGGGAVDPSQLAGGGAGQVSLTGKISWFGGPNDPSAGSMTASGAPISEPGIAVYNRQTLGGYWQVTMPNGHQAVLKQTDIGPAPWTGRKVDFTYSALPQLGYSEQNFPTDATISATYLGHNPPVAGGGAAGGGGAVPGGGGVVSTGGGGAVPGGGGVPGASAGVGAAAVTELLASPRVQMPPAVRGLIAQGGGDPRLVAVLADAATNHTIALGGLESTVEPVHAQAIDIVAVDGQPVGPGNVAARDLITEIAALDPRLRPAEIGTPWPIRSPGFFTDALHQARLHLAFVSESDYVPPTDPASAATGPAAGAPPPAAGVGPVAGLPAAAGVAQAADAALAAETAPAGGGVAAGAAADPGTAVAPPMTGGTSGAGAQAGELLGQAAPVASGDPNFASPKAHVAFEAAKSQLGVRYQWGGTSPQTGFDCSGLMQWSYAKAGISLPRVAADQFHVGTPVDLQHLREGDLVFFQDSTGYIHHVGMYVGNHQFLEAPHTGDVVKYDDLRKPYWAQQFAGGRRIVPLSTPPAAPASAPVASTAPAGPAPSVVPTPGAAPAVMPTRGAAPAVMPAAGAAPAAASAAAPRPGTAVFNALERQEQSFQRHTQQFLAALPSDPASPAPGSGMPAGAQPAAVLGAGGQPAPAAGAPAAVQAAVVAAAAPSGGAISVTSSLLTSGQEKFAGRLAELTGLDPRVISAWALAEESGSAAQGREGAGNFNWLNIGYFDSGAGAIAFDKAFRDPVSAAEQTAAFLKGKWGGASTGIRAILGSVGQGPQAQINAIATSGWASSGYAGGANLRSTYDELSGMTVSRG